MEVIPACPKLKVIVIPYDNTPFLSTVQHETLAKELFQASHAVHTPGLQYVGLQNHVFTYAHRGGGNRRTNEEELEVYELCDMESRKWDASVNSTIDSRCESRFSLKLVQEELPSTWSRPLEARI